MPVELDSSVSSTVRNALVEGDWLYVSEITAVSGMPSSAGGSGLVALPVDTTPRRNSYPICVNPLSPENSVPGVGLTVASGKGFIASTDRYNPALSTYVDSGTGRGAPLVAKSFTVSGVTRYGLVPAASNGSEDYEIVAYALGIFNNELVFRFLP